MSKKLIQIDLDGVLNTYNGNYDARRISPIKDGAYEFIEKLSKDYKLELFTVRDLEMSQKWLEENNLAQFFDRVTNIKNSFASVILDDRAVNFNGNYNDAYEKIINFKPYWK